MKVLERIKAARADGHGAGLGYIAKFGKVEARAWCRGLMVAYPQPSPEMYGYIDGFANAVI